MQIIYFIEDKLIDIAFKIVRKRISKGWGAEQYFDDLFIDSIKDFCETELKENESLKFNPERLKVYKQTRKFINRVDWDSYNRFCEKRKQNTRQYIINNISFYWN